MHVRLDGDKTEDISLGVALCLVSFLVAFFFILVHLDFIPVCEEGGWLELSSGFFCALLWTIFLAVATKDQGIAATVTGSKCSRDDLSLFVENCTIVLFQRVEHEVGDVSYVEKTLGCSDLPRQVPGSNLYFASWICFFASLNITFRWKAQQALQFAQAKQGNHEDHLHASPNTDDASQDDDEDDDEL